MRNYIELHQNSDIKERPANQATLDNSQDTERVSNGGDSHRR